MVGPRAAAGSAAAAGVAVAAAAASRVQRRSRRVLRSTARARAAAAPAAARPRADALVRARRPARPRPAVMSSNGDTNVVLRGVTHGAVDFLIKPVRVEELRNVWQHVVRRRSLHHSRAADEHSGLEVDHVSRRGLPAARCPMPDAGCASLAAAAWMQPGGSRLRASAGAGRPAAHALHPLCPRLRSTMAPSARRRRRCRCSTRRRAPTRSRAWCGAWRCTSRCGAGQRPAAGGGLGAKPRAAGGGAPPRRGAPRPAPARPPARRRAL